MGINACTMIYTFHFATVTANRRCIHGNVDEGLTLETSAFELFMVANLRYQLS